MCHLNAAACREWLCGRVGILKDPDVSWGMCVCPYLFLRCTAKRVQKTGHCVNSLFPSLTLLWAISNVY